MTDCLKILSPEKLENLEFPVSAESNFPAKRVLYRSDSSDQHSGEQYTITQNEEATRFNLFTGYQTLHEREESFKVLLCSWIILIAKNVLVEDSVLHSYSSINFLFGFFFCESIIELLLGT